MEPTKKIAVYMENLSANLIEYQDTAKEVKAISASELEGFKREKWLKKGDADLLDKEQLQLLKYYKEISDSIAAYQYVMLFGPTNAKTELQAILSHDNRFSGTEIAIKITDKLNHNEQLDFINDCFYIDRNNATLL